MNNPIFLYIDPSTGSMLFAILIGIFSAAVYMVKTWFVKLRFKFTSGGKVEDMDQKIPIAIFADDKRYWTVFKPVCEEFEKRGIDIVYMTASPDDPALNNEFSHIKAEFIGEGNRAFARLNFMKAKILIATTPGLDVYQWKRSKDVDYYIHMLHACDGVLSYRMFGLDYYDAVLVSGQTHIDDLRKIEKLRGLPQKDACIVGIPFMDKMAERLSKYREENGDDKDCKDGNVTVLLAPSWGPSSILNKYGEEFIQNLIATGYHIIIRPHPQSFTSEKSLMDSLMRKFPANEMLEWNRDNDNFDVLNRSDLLISDFSSVTYDFTLVYDKPLIYADTEFDRGPYDAWWLPEQPFWTFTAMERVGMKLSKDNFANIKDMIDECLTSTAYARGRDEVRSEAWAYPGEGSARAVDYIMAKYRELSEKSE